MRRFLKPIKILTFLLITFFGLLSCLNSTDKEQTEKTKTHERLIECKAKFVMEDGEEADGYHEDYEHFIKDYFSQDQKGDTLIVSTLFEVNACGKTIGDIEFSVDTIFLKTRQIADEVCASTMFEKFTYIIHNPEKKKYEIQSER